jgi:hypothetical protein
MRLTFRVPSRLLHSSKTIVAGAPSVRENLGRGTRRLWKLEIRISTNLGGAALVQSSTSLAAEVCGFFAEY